MPSRGQSTVFGSELIISSTKKKGQKGKKEPILARNPLTLLGIVLGASHMFSLQMLMAPTQDRCYQIHSTTLQPLLLTSKFFQHWLCDSSFSSPLILKVTSFHANLLVHEIAPIQITGKLEDSQNIYIYVKFPKAFKNENWQLTSQDHI